MHVEIARKRTLRIVTLSDTHNRHEELEKYNLMPDGDMLIHAGDFTDRGTEEEVLYFNEFLGRMRRKYRYVVVVPGNHDKCLDPTRAANYTTKTPQQLLSNATHYLVNTGVVIEGIKIYGMAMNTRCGGGFGTRDESESELYYQHIPSDTDILITHTPAHNILDLAWDRSQKSSEPCSVCKQSHLSFRHWGCTKLREYVFKKKPRVHICGHVHDARGSTIIDGITFINSGNTCGDDLYKPITFDY